MFGAKIHTPLLDRYASQILKPGPSFFPLCTTVCLEQRFGFLVRIYVYTFLCLAHMAALDLHNKCSPSPCPATAKEKTKAEPSQKQKQAKEAAPGRSRASEPCQKQSQLRPNCCRNLHIYRVAQNSSNAHPESQLVALNYQKFHSIKTHTSRVHKK